MRKKLTPIFRQISDAATPKLVKRMAGMSPVHSLLDKLLEGLRRRIQAACWRVAAAEASYFMSSSCL